MVQDCWWTASTRWADIVLPATTTVERNDISSGGTYNINKFYAMKQVIAPQGDALDDFEIFRRLAELCGVELGFTEGMEPMDYVKAAYENSSAAKLMPFEEFWEKGVVTLPTPAAANSWVRHGDFRADPVKNPLHTPSGRIEMYSTTIEKMNLPDCPPMPKWLEPAEYLGNAKKGQLHVVSPHPYMRLHSQMANAEPLRKTYAVQTREPLLINTQDAKKRGIRNGNLVELYNERVSTFSTAWETSGFGPLPVGSSRFSRFHAGRDRTTERPCLRNPECCALPEQGHVARLWRLSTHHYGIKQIHGQNSTSRCDPLTARSGSSKSTKAASE